MKALRLLDNGETVKSSISSVCAFCKHWKKESWYSCDAFEKIPEDIWEAKNNHTKPYPGDNGILFEAVNS